MALGFKHAEEPDFGHLGSELTLSRYRILGRKTILYFPRQRYLVLSESNFPIISLIQATPVRVPSGIKTSPNRVSLRQNSMKSDTHENGGETMREGTASDKGNGAPKDNAGRPRPTMGVRSIENKRDSMLNAQGS